MGLVDRFQSAWNAFMNKDPTEYRYRDIGISSGYRPDRPRFTRGNEKTIVTSVYNRIAVDVAAITFEHVRLDENDRFVSIIYSGLNSCLTVEANRDQTSRAFMQDVVMSMLDEGVVAIVPVDTTTDPWATMSFDIRSMRTAKILEWYPDHVKVRIYNDRDGKMYDKVVPKATTCIIENPLYSIMNEPNSTLQRLIRKLALLDVIDEQTGSGKLDLIIQLPYLVKSPARKQQAEDRRKDIEMQLSSSKYGIAYAESTEKITQLNRPLENKLLAQIEYLTSMLYSQLGITTTIMDGSADEQTMLNYQNRTIEPFASAIVDEMKRKFLTKAARTQKQSIYYFRNPFRLTPITQLSELIDVTSRNEILASNDWRQILGLKPVDTDRANELINKNMPVEDTGMPMEEGEEGSAPMNEAEYLQSIGELDDLDGQLDQLEQSLGHRDTSGYLQHKQYASPYYDPVKAHEYYMKNRELKNRRSTSTLNEEGQYLAKYIREQLNNERDSRVNAHSQQTKNAMAANNKKVSSQVSNNQNRLSAALLANKDTMDSRVDTNTDRLSNKLENNTENTESEIEANEDRMRLDLEKERESVQSKLSSHTSAVQSMIKQLQSQIEKLSPEQRKKRLDEFETKISALREENSKRRQELQSNYSEFSGKTRQENTEKNAEVRKENSEESEQLRERSADSTETLRERSAKKASGLKAKTKSSNDAAKQSVKDENSKLSSAHAAVKKQLHDEYEEKYLSELDKIKADERYTNKKSKNSKYTPFWWK